MTIVYLYHIKQAQISFEKTIMSRSILARDRPEIFDRTNTDLIDCDLDDLDDNFEYLFPTSLFPACIWYKPGETNNLPNEDQYRGYHNIKKKNSIWVVR